MKVYFKNRNDESKYISVSMPFTMNSIPKNPDYYKYGNAFSATPLYLNLHEDFNMACEDASKKTKFLKKSMLVTGYFILM